MNHVRPPSLPLLLGITFMLDITHTLFNQFFFFIPAMLVGIIDFYHSIPLSVTLTLAGGDKVSVERSLLASFSRTLFD